MKKHKSGQFSNSRNDLRGYKIKSKLLNRVRGNTDSTTGNPICHNYMVITAGREGDML